MTERQGVFIEFRMQNLEFKIGFRLGCALMLVLAIVFAACQAPENRTTDNSPVNSNDSSNTSGRIPMRIVTDDLERKVLVPTKITRVVSLAPSVTEMIFAAGGGGRLVGVTTFCNYPEEAKQIAKVGDTMNPNMETLVALNRMLYLSQPHRRSRRLQKRSNKTASRFM